MTFLKNIWYLCKNAKYELALGNNPIVMNKRDTLDTLARNGVSIARFGDGEFSLMRGNSIGFQAYNEQLACSLRKILVSKDERVLIGIPNTFAGLRQFKRKSRQHWRAFMVNYREFLLSNLDLQKVYYESNVTRPYITTQYSYADVRRLFQMWQDVWRGRDLVVIQNEKACWGKCQ